MNTSRIVRAALAGTVLAVPLAAASPLAAVSTAAPLVISVSGGGHVDIAGWNTQRPLSAAIARFERPRLTRLPQEMCLARWSGPGLVVRLYNLGGADACSPAGGLALDARAYGPGWRTARGLSVGDALATLRRVYPAAERHGVQWYLVQRATPIGLTVPLAAEVVDGRVRAFRMGIGAGGE